MENIISCFDAPLHYNFFKASEEGRAYDLSRILEGSFLEKKPALSVSFVENHDTQPLQSLESSVHTWFKPLAYAIILLLKDGYPCVFYPDLFGAEYSDVKDGELIKIILPKIDVLPKLLKARQHFAYGEQVDYFDHPNCVAWARMGNKEKPGCVVIISNGDKGYKEINLGKDDAHTVFKDFLGHRNDEITTDENGTGKFRVDGNSVSVWIRSAFINEFNLTGHD